MQVFVMYKIPEYEDHSSICSILYHVSCHHLCILIFSWFIYPVAFVTTTRDERINIRCRSRSQDTIILAYCIYNAGSSRQV